MKIKAMYVFLAAIFLACLLPGCGGMDVEKVTKQKSSEVTYEAEEDIGQGTQSRLSVQTDTNKPVFASDFQFVEGHGIVNSEYPVYLLEGVPALEVTKGDITIALTDVVRQDTKVVVSLIVSDRSRIERIEEDGKTSLEGEVFKLSDGTEISYEKYAWDIWKAGDGIKLTGPEIPEEGLKPEEAWYASFPEFYEEYGYMRCFIEASFELPFAQDPEKNISGYAFQVLDFEEPFEFSMKKVPSYDTLEALAAEEGSMDSHDGFFLLAVGEEVEEGILVNWYSYSESKDQLASIFFTPPSSAQKGTGPILSLGKTKFESKRNSMYIEKIGINRLPVGSLGATKQLFIVPKEKRNEMFTLTIPGITYLSSAESSPVTLQIPKDTEKLAEEISFREGNVRIHKITKMKEPQTQEREDRQGTPIKIERPAVYIDVSAVSDTKKLDLRRLICKSKSGSKYGLWENQRYDFDANGNLSGFRIFYNEGDTEISLKFSLPGFYWNQPYEMKMRLGE